MTSKIFKLQQLKYIRTDISKITKQGSNYMMHIQLVKEYLARLDKLSQDKIAVGAGERSVCGPRHSD